jgi:hypothetical protein
MKKLIITLFSVGVLCLVNVANASFWDSVSNAATGAYNSTKTAVQGAAKLPGELYCEAKYGQSNVNYYKCCACEKTCNTTKEQATSYWQQRTGKSHLDICK